MSPYPKAERFARLGSIKRDHREVGVAEVEGIPMMTTWGRRLTREQADTLFVGLGVLPVQLGDFFEIAIPAVIAEQIFPLVVR